MEYRYYNNFSKKQEVLLKAFLPLNWLFKGFNLPIEVSPSGDANNMITLEQRINLFHLMNDVLHHEVPGEIVELGCHVGNSTMQMQSILQQHNSSKQLHVYDKFGSWDEGKSDMYKLFVENFSNSKLTLPIIHPGLFQHTIPKELPDVISFVHIDAGYGGELSEYVEIMLLLLKNIYSRLPKNGICLLMDYHDTSKTVHGLNANPGVKAACDIFLEDKPENVHVLYGNRFSHGYFRKVS